MKVRDGFAVALALALAQVAGGCRGSKTPERAPDTVIAAPTATDTAGASVASPAPGDPCPAYGLWRPCSVEDRISRAGLAVKRREEGVKHDFLHVDGLVWETSRAEIQVFIYPSEAERKRDTDALDTVAVAPKGRRIIWRQPATLVTSGNLAAIVISLNPRQAERIVLALGAGLPAAPR